MSSDPASLLTSRMTEGEVQTSDSSHNAARGINQPLLRIFEGCRKRGRYAETNDTRVLANSLRNRLAAI